MSPPVEGAFDLLGVGHPSVDLMFSGLQTWPELGRDVDAGNLGVSAGTSFNTPAAANRLGLRVGYISIVGNDVWSGLTREEYEKESLPTDLLRVVDRPMPFVSVALNSGTDRGFVTYDAMREEDEAELYRYALDVVSTADARHLHYYAGEPPALAEAAHDRGMTVSMDAWGGPWWEEPEPLEELLPRGDVILANESEAIAMTGAPDVGRAMSRMAELCACVVIKRGADGAIATADGDIADAPAEPAQLVDATGAGDCFNAGFLAGWLAKLPLEECLTLGNICGARAVESFGGYLGCPREAEFREIARSKGIDLP
ncbi:MAG: carbohydrate kinase family protein [Actinomycetota bacterium]